MRLRAATRANEAIRQRMRLHQGAKRVSSHPEGTPPPMDSGPGPENSGDRLASAPRHAIVSINGRDVDEEVLMRRKTA
jgi:hypothetical protein